MALLEACKSILQIWENFDVSGPEPLDRPIEELRKAVAEAERSKGSVATTEGAFYVYSLKDPRASPAKPFYIGKGVGTRAWDHLVQPDKTAKGQRIAEIEAAGHKVLVTMVCDGLTELQALKMEAELIASFGTVASGGMLLNAVLPTGKRGKVRRDLVIPLGAPEKAQLGLSLLKDAVLELAQANEEGVTNSEVCHALGLHSNYAGGSKDYLSWSILGLLMKEGRMKRENSSAGRGYHQAQVR